MWLQVRVPDLQVLQGGSEFGRSGEEVQGSVALLLIIAFNGLLVILLCIQN